MRLLTPYLCDDPRPELVDVWRAQAESSVSRKFALEDHEEAMDFLLEAIHPPSEKHSRKFRKIPHMGDVPLLPRA